jgi:hypothetical protein
MNAGGFTVNPKTTTGYAESSQPAFTGVQSNEREDAESHRRMTFGDQDETLNYSIQRKIICSIN